MVTTEKLFCECHNPLPKCQPYPLNPEVHENRGFKEGRGGGEWEEEGRRKGAQGRLTAASRWSISHVNHRASKGLPEKESRSD